MSAKTWCVVYNGTDRSQVVDEEGRTLDPTGFTYARRSVVKELIDQDQLIVVDPSGIQKDSNPDARMAAEEAQKRNDAIDADKAENDTPAKEEAPKPSSGKNR